MPRDARIRDALYPPRRVPSSGQHDLHARCRHLFAVALFDEGACPSANYFFRHRKDPPARCLVAALATRRGDCLLGTLLSLGAVTFPTPKRPSTSPESPTRPLAMAISCLRSPTGCLRRSKASSASLCAACPWAISLSSSTASFRGNHRQAPPPPAKDER